MRQAGRPVAAALQVSESRSTSVLNDLAQATIVPGDSGLGTCDLCASPSSSLISTVTVGHERGGSARFAACEGCTRALRRIAAVAGGPLRFAIAPEAGAARTVTRSGTEQASAASRPGLSELIEERAEQVQDADGYPYLVRILGQPRADGTWIGRVEFVAADGSAIRRTGPETTQSSREQVAYWASGLEALYFEGAFRRAQPVGALA
jgi:hypothetical protein